MSNTIAQIHLRCDTTANWAAVNPVLGIGEPAVELSGSGVLFKIGDGTTRWLNLKYQTGDFDGVVAQVAQNTAAIEANTGDISNLQESVGTLSDTVDTLNNSVSGLETSVAALKFYSHHIIIGDGQANVTVDVIKKSSTPIESIVGVLGIGQTVIATGAVTAGTNAGSIITNLSNTAGTYAYSGYNAEMIPVSDEFVSANLSVTDIVTEIQ